MSNVHVGDFGDDHWLLLVEDDGPDGLGRVLGYFVFTCEVDAAENDVLGMLCDELGLFVAETIPSDVQTEILTYKDFRASYGNRMPLTNRGYSL